MPPQNYFETLFEEIRQKHKYYPAQELDTLYFGGGTPSLVEAPLIVSVIDELAKYGFTTGRQTEVTIEINPATVDERKLELYLKAGFNRFSVGAQTFEDRLLKMVHREHNALQTLQTLELLRKYKLNFSFDILFALPSQSLAGLKNDVEIAMQQGAQHISPYCLTVPEGHPLSKGRPIEDEQIEMFNLITRKLQENQFVQYEISNFAKPGRESQHNLLYWTDEPYWGLGLSAHSYHKNSPWGTRYWNISAIGEYHKQILSQKGQEFRSPESQLPAEQFECLEAHQALTDFCHTSLRLMRGLSKQMLLNKFSDTLAGQVVAILQKQQEKGRLQLNDNEHWTLTAEGLVLSNQVFAELTFLKEDLASSH